MKFLEDILRNRLKDATSREGVQSDDLWASIADALPAEKPVRNSRKPWLLLSLLFVSTGVLYFYFSNFNETYFGKNTSDIVVIAQEKRENIEMIGIKEEKINNADLHKTQTTDNELIANKKEINKPTSISQKKTSNQAKKSEKIVKNIRTNVVVHNLKTNSITKSVTATSEPFVTLQEAQSSLGSLTLKESPSTEPVEAQTIKNKTATLLFQSIGLLASKAFFVKENEEEKDLTNLALAINRFPKTQKKKKKLHVSLSAYSGINTWKNYFENTNKGDLLQNAYKSRLGYSVGTEVQFTLVKNLSFSTGLEYSKTMAQFNIVQEKDGFTDNPNTVEVDEVRAKIVRTVRHHNRLDFLTVPLVVSTGKEFGKFELGIGAGLGLNMTIRQGGKSLNAEDEIVDYYPSTGYVFTPYKSFISYHLRPALRFNATEKLSVQMRPEFRYNSHGKSDFFGLKHSSLMTNLNLGLTFNL